MLRWFSSLTIILIDIGLCLIVLVSLCELLNIWAFKQISHKLSHVVLLLLLSGISVHDCWILHIMLILLIIALAFCAESLLVFRVVWIVGLTLAWLGVIILLVHLRLLILVWHITTIILLSLLRRWGHIDFDWNVLSV